MIKKIAGIALCVCLLLSTAVFALGAQRSTASKYPCVFVSGMFGWGEYDEEIYSKTPYWGFSKGDIVQQLRENGTVCCAASTGPLSSAWDRACDLYAQLTGTVTDYGAAHSLAHSHSRYGRSYEGRALLESFGNEKINLFGHSFGGATIRQFTYLLANGASEELEATGEDTSALFTGGKAHLVNSVTTLSSPHNGTVIADDIYSLKLPIYALGFMINGLSAVGKSFVFDMKLDQFSLTADPASGVRAPFSLKAISNFSKQTDNCGYDLTMLGASQLNERISEVEGVYYFSYTCRGTRDSRLGYSQIPMDIVGANNYATAYLVGHSSGRTVAGIELTDEWEPNDGLVPVKSGAYPLDEPHEDFVSPEKCEPGIWYVMPVIEGNHGTYMGAGDFDGLAFYNRQIEMINSLS